MHDFPRDSCTHDTFLSFHGFVQVATVLDQLHKFLGPELKAVTGESAGIDEIMDRVEGLALPLNKVTFDCR